MLPDFGRADRIGEFLSYPESRAFADLLIDCEEDRTLRAVLVGMLREDGGKGDGDALSGKESAADTRTMPFIFVLAAFAVVAVLMVIGMRQRWIPGPRGRWIPGARGRWEPGARGGWEPGAQPEPPPLPRAQWVLAVVGWGVVLIGMLLGSILRDSLFVILALATYGATWLARMILVNWTEATSWSLRIAAIARPLALVAGIVLTTMTRSISWLIVGAVVFVGAPLAAHLIHGLRRDRCT